MRRIPRRSWLRRSRDADADLEGNRRRCQAFQDASQRARHSISMRASRPELYLKRLLVGGFEKVYELNRNFRNEGIDRTHNPEFTMLEFYWAYADVNQMMDFCEEMLRATVFKALGHTHVRYGEHDIDFAQPFQRLTMKEAIRKFGDQLTSEM